MGNTLKFCVGIFICCNIFAADYYASKTGNAGNPGTMLQPWSILAALTQKQNTVQPGDTVWIRGGTYNYPADVPIGGLYVSLIGETNNPITVRAYGKERAIITVAFVLRVSFLTVRDLEFTDLSSPFAGPDTYASREAWESDLDTAYPRTGIAVETDNIKIINCLIYDCPQGTRSNGGSEWYGNIVLNTGAIFGDTSTVGEGMYAQNGQYETGIYAYFENNIYSMGRRGGLSLWSSGVGTLKRMVARGNMSLFLPINCRANDTFVSDDTLTNNIVADVPGALRDYPPLLSVGYGTGPVGGVSVVSNLLLLAGIEIKNTTNSLFTGNTVAGTPAGIFRMINIANSHDFTMSKNSYTFSTETQKFYRDDTNLVSWAGYTNATGLDGDSTFTITNFPSTNIVKIFTNKYELGRLHIFVANFQSNSAVQLDLDGYGIKNGSHYEIRYINNYFGNGLTGTYAGPISLPMTGWSIAQPKFLTVARAGGSPVPLYDEATPLWGAFLFTSYCPPTLNAGTIRSAQ